MGISVAPNVTPHQLRQAAALLVTSGLVGTVEDALEELRAYHARDPGLIVVLQADSAVAGVGIGSYDGYRGTLRRLAVSERWRGLGLGRWLAAELEHRLLERGARLLRLHVEGAAARGFWERLGYGALDLCYLGKDPYRHAAPQDP